MIRNYFTLVIYITHFSVRSHSTGRSVRDLSSAFTGSGLPPAILAAQKEAERQRQIMAVLQREKQIFEQMQRDSSTFRQKEQVSSIRRAFYWGVQSKTQTSIVLVLDDKYLKNVKVIF